MVFVVSFLLLFSAIFSINAQQSSKGVTEVNFQVRTTSPGGNYAPRNIGAIWVEDSAGSFVKTLKVWAQRRIQYLYTWNTVSGGNTINAVTGATISSHITHHATWDLTDVNGNPVSPGTYRMRMEITDRHAQGPLNNFTFPVGGATDTLYPPEQQYFHDMELVYVLDPTGIAGSNPQIPKSCELYQNYPNPFNPSTNISFQIAVPGFVSLKIYDITGREIATLITENLATGRYQYEWDATQFASGVYYYRLRVSLISAKGASEAGLSSGVFVQTRKLVVLK